MTAEEQANIDRIDRDRRRRERALLLLLLLFGQRALLHARSALRVGGTPGDAADSAADAIAGASYVDGPPLRERLLPLLKEVWQRGIWRAFRLADVVLPQYEAGLAHLWEAAAGELATKTADAVRRATQQSVLEARQSGLGTTATLAKLTGDWKAAGLHPANAYALEAAAERAVVTGYAGGMYSGFYHPSVAGLIVGFAHRTILDGRETEICHVRAGFMRPVSDPYWRLNWPSLHWGCRSLILPLFREQEWSQSYPDVSPQPGFGRAPATAFGVRVGA